MEIFRFGGIGGEIVKLQLGEAGRAGGRVVGRGPAAGAGTEREFPRALADRKHALDRVVDDGFAPRGAVGAEERREEAHAILARIRREGGTENLGTGGEEIDVTDKLRVRGCGFDLSRPAGEERHAVAALPDVGFVAAELRAGEVAQFLEAGRVGLRRAAVVGGENDEGVFGEAVSVEGGENFSNDGVGLHREIGVGAKAAFALPLGRRENRRVGRRERDVEEKRFP